VRRAGLTWLVAFDTRSLARESERARAPRPPVFANVARAMRVLLPFPSSALLFLLLVADRRTPAPGNHAATRRRDRPRRIHKWLRRGARARVCMCVCPARENVSACACVCVYGGGDDDDETSRRAAATRAAPRRDAAFPSGSLSSQQGRI